MKEYQNHPLAEIFPMLGNGELKELAEDIRQSGLQIPIVLFEGKILDGRNRYAACKLSGSEGKFEEYTGAEPLQHIIGLNLHRRHLSESQRAMIAAKIADLEVGNMAFSEESSNCANLRNSHVSQTEAAKLLNVGRRSVQIARSIIKKAPEKVNEIETGKKTVNKAMKEIKAAEPPKQEKPVHPSVTIDNGREKAIQHAVNAINELKKIPVNEESRREAFKMVKNYINQNSKEAV